MSDTYKDPIVEQIHETRHEILARHGGSLSSYLTAVSERKIPGVTYVATPAYSNRKLKKASWAIWQPGTGELKVSAPPLKSRGDLAECAGPETNKNQLLQK